MYKIDKLPVIQYLVKNDIILVHNAVILHNLLFAHILFKLPFAR